MSCSVCFIDFESKFCQYEVDVISVKLPLNEHLSEQQFIYCRILLP